MFYDLSDYFAEAAYAPAFDDDDRLLKPEDVADLLGMSIDWVHHTFSVPARGGIKPLKIGRTPTGSGPDRRPSRWPAYEVKAWIAARDRERQVTSR